MFAPGIVGYPGVTATAAETWTPPGRAVTAGVLDAEGHPLTWGCVAAAHAWLVHHASCEQQVGGGYSSDDEMDTPACPCTWHPVAIEEREAHLFACRIWPGPICGSCWAASCACGYVFETVADARTRWPNGRLCCYACAE